MIMRGFSSWIRSQPNPIRSSAPGAKFSTSTSQCLTSRSSTCLPCSLFVSSVIERLLWFNMVKYRLSSPGTSRSCSRVISPVPAFSTLMTSAPNHASSCVQVGPDCTCVKSRIRTPSNALLIPDSATRLLIHCLVLGARRVLARVDPDIDHRRAAQLAHRLTAALQRRRNLRRIPHFLAVAAQHLGEFPERHIAEQIADAAALLAVFGELAVADLIHRGVIADHGQIRDA